ncbi:MAG: hypothetical protein J2P29_09500, partial [Actinobacteria bacterium]|nr:hypothetical protein [Actinomycetota bacterium]
MRYRLMATYEGSPYEAGLGPTENDVILFAACPPPEDLAFEPAVGYWRKQVPISEVQAVWESRPVGTFRGERCLVLDDLGDQLHITYLGHDGVTAGRLGYVEVDRGVFELIVTRSEVTNVTEDRLEVPVPARSAPAEHPAVPRAEPAPPAPSILGPADPVPADLLQADLLQADLLQADLLQADPPPV